MPRAYSPRLSTAHLAGDIGRLDGIESVRILPPQTLRPRTLLRVTLTTRNPWGEPVFTDFTIPEARAWLASEKER